ncbi:GTPase [Phycicoccus flavus]|uniref:ABC transporter n=1 Tax=Phycicoccus flavus TaxID=2502783 RepID=A0A8T6R0Z8_9MICO|nr:GTPase [Phycicoccus flavus]NHA67516.1 ABC transporter [Phycicoccus flavus]
MSPVRTGTARGGAAVSPERLAAASASLAAAVDAGGEELPEPQRARARDVVAKVERRTSIAGGHTVVALAGATGSGKSSLFNALVGTDVAKVGVRRPTTSTPTAAVWGTEPAGELLDWLGVGSRHLLGADDSGPQVGSLDGLVLLDLPDVDSRETANRDEAQRVLELVDLFVWVADPQKYADSRLHDDHVATLSSHEVVTMAVLNQSDRLAPEDLGRLRTDLVRLMERDGLPGATVLATSARTGAGVDELRQRLANAVAGRAMARARLAADVRTAAGTLSGHVATGEGGVAKASRSELLDALARSAGVPAVVEAVRRDYRMEAAADTSWPFTRWVHRLRARPLRRLRLDGRDVGVTESDVRSVLGRSSLPPPSPAARAAVELATRRVADGAGADLPTPWAEAVQRAATPPGPELGDALDQAVVGTSLHARRPVWWRVVGLVQLVLAWAAIAGALWLVAYAVAGWLQLDALLPDAPAVGVLPVPFLLLLGGLVLGPLLAALSAWLARIGARRRGAVMDARLRSSIETVADDEILAPVRRVLDRHAATREALRHAADV